MRSTSRASRSDAPVRRAAHILGALGATFALAAGGCDNDLGDVPFGCLDGMCPSGYQCIASVCVRNGASVPTLVTPTVNEGEATFDLQLMEDNNVFVSWNQGSNTRDPGMFGAIVTPTAALNQRPALLYPLNQAGATVLLGTSGTCRYRPGGQVVCADVRQSSSDSFVFRLVATTVDGRNASAFYETMPYIGSEVVNMRATDVGPDSWYMYTAAAGGFRPERVSNRVALPNGAPGASPQPTRLNLPLISDPHFRSIELYGSDTGAWYAALLGSSTETLFAWLARTGDGPGGFIISPEAQYLAAFPLAVRDDELAVAFQLDRTNWRIWWVRPSDTRPDAEHSGSVVSPGPNFTMAPDVVRPGGYVVGNRLVIAGAQDADHVTLWSTGWNPPQGSPDANVTQVARLPKLTRTPPRRLAVIQAGGRLLVVWTEIIPASETGAAQYTALFASSAAAP